MVYVQCSTSSHNVQIYRIWYNSILIMKGINYGRFISVYQPQDVGYVLQQQRYVYV